MAASRVLEKSDVLRLLRLLNDLHEAGGGGAGERWQTLLAGVCDLASASGGVVALRPDGGEWGVAHRHGLEAGAAAQLTRVTDAAAAPDRHDPALRRLHRQSR